MDNGAGNVDEAQLVSSSELKLLNSSPASRQHIGGMPPDEIFRSAFGFFPGGYQRVRLNSSLWRGLPSPRSPYRLSSSSLRLKVETALMQRNKLISLHEGHVVAREQPNVVRELLPTPRKLLARRQRDGIVRPDARELRRRACTWRWVAVGVRATLERVDCLQTVAQGGPTPVDFGKCLLEQGAVEPVDPGSCIS